MTSPILATFVGGPTLLLRYAGLTFLTDPTFDAAPAEYPSGTLTLRKLVGPALEPGQLGRVDVVLLSHDQHPDNLDREGRAYLAQAPLVLSTPAAAGRLDGVQGSSRGRRRCSPDRTATSS